MASLDLTSKFCGMVSGDCYKQSIAVVLGEGRYVGVYETQTFEFAGLTYAEAHHYGAVTATDVSGHVYNLSFAESFTDSSSGYAVAATEQNRVTRTRMSPTMWSVTVTRSGMRLIKGNTVLFNGPSWMQCNGGTN